MTLWGSAKEDTYFTSLDSMKGYHQVKMVEGYGSKEKAAFTCHQGLFQYWRIPFGWTMPQPLF